MQTTGRNPTEGVGVGTTGGEGGAVWSWSLDPLLGGTRQSIHWGWSVMIVLLGLEKRRIGPIEKFLKNKYIILFPS